MDELIDMSLELWDDGFNVQVNSEDVGERYITVKIHKRMDFKTFQYEDIKDQFLMMVSYMKSEGFPLGFIDGILMISRGNTGFHQKYNLGLKNDELCFLSDQSHSFRDGYRAGTYTNFTFNTKEGEKVTNPIDQLVIKFRI
jgi:hypothetical protein